MYENVLCNRGIRIQKKGYIKKQMWEALEEIFCSLLNWL